MSFDVVLKLLPWACKIGRWFTGRKPQRATVLVVEDDGNDALLLERGLRKVGYECEIAQSGEVAQALVERSFYSVAFVDLRLPGLSGQALVRLLSKGSPDAGLVVVCGEPSDLSDIEAGVPIVVIRKPVNTEGLLKLFKRFKFD